MGKIDYHKQETIWTCGATAMRIVLSSIGIIKSEKEVVRILKTNKIRGTWHKNYPELAEKIKLSYIVIRKAEIKDIKDLLRRKFSVIVCYYIPREKVDHYAVVNKIDNKFIHFFDPFYGDKYRLSLTNFIKIWKSDPKYDNEKKWLFGVKKD